VCVLCAALAAQGESPSFTKGKEVARGAPGSFDYLSIDAAARKLYVAHGTRIEVLDADSGEKVGTVDGLEGAPGVLFAPELKRGFATSGRKAELLVFDAALKVEKKIATGAGPDALLVTAG